MEKLCNQLLHFSEGWSPPNNNKEYSKNQIEMLVKTIHTIEKREWEVHYQIKGIKPKLSGVTNEELQDESRLLGQELVHLYDQLARACWPWVEFDKKRRHLSIDAEVWYWTLVRVFIEWKLHVIERYEKETLQASGLAYSRRLERRIKHLHDDPDVQIKLLHWWLKWGSFNFSDTQIEKHLAPQLGLYLQYGQWQRAY